MWRCLPEHCVRYCLFFFICPFFIYYSSLEKILRSARSALSIISKPLRVSGAVACSESYSWWPSRNSSSVSRYDSTKLKQFIESLIALVKLDTIRSWNRGANNNNPFQRGRFFRSDEKKRGLENVKHKSMLEHHRPCGQWKKFYACTRSSLSLNHVCKTFFMRSTWKIFSVSSENFFLLRCRNFFFIIERKNFFYFIKYFFFFARKNFFSLRRKIFFYKNIFFSAQM